MKSSLTNIIRSAIVGKKIAKQNHIHENYWGATILDVWPASINYGSDTGYVINTNAPGCSTITMYSDFELELE